MRQLVDDVLASGVEMQIVVEVEHRTSILPLVLARHRPRRAAVSVDAAGPTRGRRRAAASTRRRYLQTALVSRKADLTPAAQAFLEVPAPT